MIVHVQTVIVTTFGVLDDAGNVNPQKPIQMQMNILSLEMFAEAYQALMQAKAQMAEQTKVPGNMVANAQLDAVKPPFVEGKDTD